jgi:hypothetical protein
MVLNGAIKLRMVNNMTKLELLEELWSEAALDVVKYLSDKTPEEQWRKSIAQSAMTWLEMKIKENGGRQNG